MKDRRSVRSGTRLSDRGKEGCEVCGDTALRKSVAGLLADTIEGGSNDWDTPIIAN